MKQKEGAKKPFSVLCAVALVASLCLPTAALADVGASDQAQGANSAASAGQVADAQAAAGDAADAGAAQPAKEAADGEALAAEPAVQSDDEGAAVQAEGVAAIGDTQHATLQGAIDAAKDGDTIKLLADVPASKTNVPKGKRVTLDLAGKTISFDTKGETTDESLNVYGSLTVTDSSEGAAGCISETSDANGCGIYVDGGELTLGKGAIKNPSSYGYGIYALNSGTVVVNGGSIESWNASLSGNNTTGDMNFKINGGVITAEYGPAIYMPGQVHLDMTDGVLNGGISLRMGQVNISGGTINSVKDNIDSPAKYYDYSGNVWLPDAIYVFGGTYTSENAEFGNSLNVSITGGNINCLNSEGSAVAVYDLGKVEQSASVSISGSAVLSSKGRSAYQVLSLSDIGVANPETGYGVFSGGVKSSISGGNFSPICPKADYIADGYVAVENRSKKTYDVVKSGASAGTGEAKGDAAVIPSEVKPEISSDSANELANAAASAAKDIKEGKKPSDLALDDSQSIQNLAGQVKDGDTVSVTLAVDAQPAAKPDSDIASKKKSDEEQYDIDISVGMLVTVTDEEGKQKPTAYSKVTKLPQGIEITVTVAPSFIKDKNVRIARNHGGTVDFIEPTKVDYATGEITFTTNLFSSYAVLASAKPAPAPVVTHAVSFVDKFNNVINVADVEDGQVVAQPKDPSFDGYEFVGWFTDEAAQNKYDFSTPVKGDLTLYAGYKKVEQPSGDNGKGDNGGTADKPANTADAPAATALAQTGDNVAPIALGAVALGVLLIAAGALVLRRRSQR